MEEDIELNIIADIAKDNDFKLCIKQNENYINIPKELLEKKSNFLGDYIRVYSLIEKLKDSLSKYLFDENSSITIDEISNNFIKIKKEENLEHIQGFLNIDINKIELKVKTLCGALSINIDDINLVKEGLISNYVNNSYESPHIVDKEYVNDIINHINNSHMYTLKDKSRYGSISSESDIKTINDILDSNNEEINGEYSPILVIYNPAKYLRGKYVLEDTHYVYIKKQPLGALIKQEKLEEKGIDSMGAIIYKKLRHDLTNENLQEILAELYVYSKKNNLKFENIRLADITSNKVWMTADKLKSEFKELRYYHKKLTQKVKDIYDSTGEYYTQISGKYIFNSRELIKKIVS